MTVRMGPLYVTKAPCSGGGGAQTVAAWLCGSAALGCCVCLSEATMHDKTVVQVRDCSNSTARLSMGGRGQWWGSGALMRPGAC